MQSIPIAEVLNGTEVKGRQVCILVSLHVSLLCIWAAQGIVRLPTSTVIVPLTKDSALERAKKAASGLCQAAIIILVNSPIVYIWNKYVLPWNT